MTRTAAFLLVAACLPGCSLIPTYERPAAPVAAAFPSGPAYAGDSTDGPAAAADVGWRDFLRDARLQRIVELALASNRDLLVAVANVEVARAQARIQRASLFPQISGYADASRSRTSDNTSSSTQLTPRKNPVNVAQAGISGSWDLDLFGRLKSLTTAAAEQYLSTAYARQAVEILLVSQVADQYLTVLAFDDQFEVTARTLANARASYDIVKLQFDTGTGTELALRQAETVVASAESTEAAQQRGRAQAENALVLLVGAPLPADLPPSAPLGDQSILADVPAGLPSDLLTRRPDILEAEAALRSENANIGAARAAFFPNISLTGNLGTASASLGSLFAGASTLWSLGPTLTVPLFDGGALAANLDIAEVRRDIGVAQYEKAIQTAFREVADGLAARGTWDRQLAADERNASAQQRALELSEFRYRNGIDNYLTVLTAQTNTFNASLAVVSTRLTRLTTLVDLYRALGGGWLTATGDTPRPALSSR